MVPTFCSRRVPVGHCLPTARPPSHGTVLLWATPLRTNEPGSFSYDAKILYRLWIVDPFFAVYTLKPVLTENLTPTYR
jgi:hypothetical protein